jgi:ribosomal protein S18 acetylase RimI-like enzyme
MVLRSRRRELRQMSGKAAVGPHAGSRGGPTRAGVIDNADIVDAVKPMLRAYPYEQYRNYPASDQNAGEGFYLDRLGDMASGGEWSFFSVGEAGSRAIVGCRISKWDEDVFGVKMAFVSVICSEPGVKAGTLEKLAATCLKYLSSKGVRFVSARVNGDNLPAIHALESAGFRYYETVIWPVASAGDIVGRKVPGVRPMSEKDFGRVAEIAGNHSYSRGHYYCDPGFDRARVDGMCVKWVTGAFRKGEPVAVIETGGEVAGYFAFLMDERLSKALGRRYARMRHLAIDSRYRGKGLGARLFKGTMSMMKGMGAEYVDSGYSTKNHSSARLHSSHGFHSVYEEATLHLWL